MAHCTKVNLIQKSIVQAMKILIASWEAVTQDTVIKCFGKSFIFFDAQRATITDSEYLWKDLQENVDALKAGVVIRYFKVFPLRTL